MFARATTLSSSLRLLLVFLPVLVCLSACEVVANFDPKRLNTDRTVGPVPLPSSDGAVALIPDAAALPDGALIQPEASDAQVVAQPRRDAAVGLDAASGLDAAASADAGEAAHDAASEAEADSGLVGLLDAGS